MSDPALQVFRYLRAVSVELGSVGACSLADVVLRAEPLVAQPWGPQMFRHLGPQLVAVRDPSGVSRLHRPIATAPS